MGTFRRFLSMVHQFPVRSAVFIGAPLVGLVLQFAISFYHGISLVVPTSFALVVLGGSIITTRKHLAEFQVRQVYRESGIERV